MAEVEIRGDKAIAAKLRRIAKFVQNPRRELAEFGKQTATALGRQRYPPELPGQRYQRTGKLGRSWDSEPLGTNAVKITNDAAQLGKPYTEYVVGVKQASVHEGRWWIALNTVKERAQIFATEIGRTIRVIWNG